MKQGETMNKTISRIISMIMALALTVGIFTPGQAKSIAAETAFTFVAEADTMAKEPSPDSIYPNAQVLYVRADPAIESYFQFTVAGISGTVTSAKLRLYVVEGTDNGPAVYTTSNSWTESGLTWNNRPARTSGPMDDKGPLAANTWVEYDVTPIVTGNGTYSFLLAMESKVRLSLSSSEGSPAPELVVAGEMTGAAPTNTPASSDSQSDPSPVPTTVLPTNTPIAPAPTTIAPTATSVPPTSAPVQPSPTATLASTPSVPQSVGSGGMWITSNEIMRLPTSGRAWDSMRSAAYGGWGTADLKNQDNKHAIYTLAGALVYARTGDTSMRAKVRDGILAAKRSMDASAEWQTDNGVLAAGRQIGAYVISADIIGLRNFDANTDNEFRGWLATIRTTNIGTHGRWKSITFTCENAAANWGTFACASRIAASIYIGDTADVNRAANIIRAFLGERSAYPADAPGRNGYFQHTGGYDPSWVCNDASWTGINPGCVKSGVNLDGVLVEDAARGGGCCNLQGSGVGYSWEALQGLFVSAELLYRTGAYGNPYQWSNQALKRSLDFMQRSGWGISNVAKYVPWMANVRYGTAYPVANSITGRILCWGDWMYQR
jgi:hypothetical protein